MKFIVNIHYYIQQNVDYPGMKADKFTTLKELR